MERDFEDDDSFELFMQKKVDQYKMYPSEGVWKGIYYALHARRRWFTIGGSLLFLTGVILLSQKLFFPGSSVLMVNKPTGQKVPPTVLTKSPPITVSARQVADYPLNKRLVKAPVSDSLQVQRPALVTTRNTGKPYASTQVADRLKVKQLGSDNLAPLNVAVLPEFKHQGTDEPVVDNVNNMPETPVEELRIDKDETSLHNATSLNNKDDATEKKINWLQEMAVIKLTPPKKNRFNMQIYFSPTVSYRKLADNGDNINANQQNVPLALHRTSIDRYVDHVPSVGVEMGSNVLYTALKNLTIKTGLQLNYSRYNIKAYSFYYEKASIALNRVGMVLDTITAYTSLRNFSGNSPENLQNQYLQVSMPVGAELKLIGNKRLQLNIAGTIQPTYLLFNDTYLLSMDYVNYAKEESLVRKWNVHTSVEAFISYKAGGVRWQLGPQFRYQLMSSYNDRYPIKEYLKEYGVKLGLSKTIK